MTFDLENWHPSCEQAKHLAGSFRIAGIAFFAAVAGPSAHAIIAGKDIGWYPHLTVLFGLIDWMVFEFVGYMILGKGGC